MNPKVTDTDVKIDQKIDYWKKKLIDLSKRNNLVNYRFTKSKSIQINSNSLEKILEDLYHEENVVILDNEASPKERQWIATEDKETITKKLYTLYSKTKENFQELGINTCFVSIGTLKYKDADDSDLFFKAPIFLFPVEIIRNGNKYELISGSEDLQLNPAIKEKLERDFRIILDTFKEGTLSEYLQDLRKKILEKADWEINDEVHIDIFSYQKYVMYEDLEAHHKTTKDNILIRAYVGGENALKDENVELQSDDFNDATSIDILPADSSQKKAVELAKAGVTFVLQGPPGTGKSQTITNIISALIERKKKVLFVSQKMAALKVVEKRLKEVGLDRYCLNLHEYRGNKKEIVNQLWSALEESPKIPSEVERYGFEEYLQCQKDINDYYPYICQRHKPWNLSIYDIRGELAKLYDVDLLDMNLEDTLTIDQKKFLAIKGKLEQLDYYFQKFNDPFTHVLFKYQEDKNTNLQNLKFEKELDSLISGINCLRNDLSNLQKKTELTLFNFDNIRDLINAQKQLKKINPDAIPASLISSDFNEKAEGIKKLNALHTEVNEVRGKIAEKVDLTFLEQDTKDAEYVFVNTSFLGRLINKEYRNHKKQLSHLSNKPLSHAEWLLLFGQKSGYKKLIKELEDFAQNKKTIHALLRDCGNTQEVQNLNQTASQLSDVFRFAYLIDHNSGYKVVEFLRESGVDFEKTFDNITEIIRELNEFFDSEVLSSKGEIINLLDKASDMKDSLDALCDILVFKGDYNSLSNEIQAFGKKYTQKKLNHKFSEVLLKSYYLQLDKILKTAKNKPQAPLKSQHIDDNLQVCDRVTKTPNTPNRLIEKFRNDDNKVRDLWRYKIMEGVEASKPKEIHMGSGYSELSTLKREYEKKRRLKPIRELLQEIPNLAFALKPCFMMSPLSVSQYIDPENIKFDVVIFDEASQIMPEDAVPCLIRAEQAIIVGDTQQLPPTTFFLNQENEESDEEIEDLESFLSEASTKFSTKSLNWHYRSKNENLIAFSNSFFYNNRLITFPNSKKDNTGLELVYARGGIYDRGKSRKNTEEAKQVVIEYQKLKTEYPERSIGIIAFNIQQENAIKDAFKEAGISIEEAVDPQEEDLFIKNLETVQGDERDIIIISIGYGKDIDGKFSYNFGPINKEGGYKRLNVAITRSRYKTIVVTSILPEDLDNDKLNAGVRYLKDYLDYAKNGDSSNFSASSNEISFDSKFEEAVYDAIKKEGLEMSKNVGRSNYRIDIAIKHPQKQGEYILGIDCDGSQYKSSRYARDRDKIRPEILKTLEWNIHRIWSEDWLRNREQELEKIRGRIQSATVDKKEDKNPNRDREFSKVENITKLREIPLKTKYSNYKICELPLIETDLTFDSYGVLYNPQHEKLLKSRLIKVLLKEGPIEKELLFRRVINSIGIQKIGSRIEKLLGEILRDINRQVGVYVYQDTFSINPIDKVTPARASTEDQRPFILIPKEEISSVIIDLLKNNFSTTKEALIRDITQVYGLKRTGNKIDAKVEQAIGYLADTGIIQENNNRIKLTKV
ncbi:MAG: DUF3320 domain-containing protein [Candidatus Altiarchaeia archaeon]